MENMNFGTRVEEMLKKNMVKPSDFYKKVGIVSQNYYDWKKKNAIPNAMTALKIAQYFGVTVEFLLTGKDFFNLQKEYDETTENSYKRKYENLKKTIINSIDSSYAELKKSVINGIEEN